jgi:hypothetical protein
MIELKALIIKTPHIDNIMSGEKTWEMRSALTKQRGLVGLIRGGSPGKIIGVVEIVDSLGKILDDNMLANQSKHLMTRERLNDPEASKYRYAWVLKNAKRLKRAISFEQKPGSVIWVNLDAETSATLMREIA